MLIMSRPIAIRTGFAAAVGLATVLALSTISSSFGAPPKPPQAANSAKAWVMPDVSTIPAGPLGDTIRLGMNVFNDTPKYAEKYVGNKLSCTHCHIDGGTVSKGMPMIGLPGIFPMYRDREKTVITFEERIEQCFQRSESGHRVPNDGPEMTGLVAYVQWLSKDQVTGHPYAGRGLVDLPELSGDADRGAKIYTDQCAICHGKEGKGTLPVAPALWGPDSYSDGAGMNQIPKMAAFVQHNMPQNAPDTLTPQEAYDVATFVHSKPHSQFVMKDHMELPN
jgi:thiosulfate dehydrogenase